MTFPHLFCDGESPQAIALNYRDSFPSIVS